MDGCSWCKPSDLGRERRHFLRGDAVCVALANEAAGLGGRGKDDALADRRAERGRVLVGERITGLAREYNSAMLVIERNNHGTGILALASTSCCYPRIYAQNNQPGWLTTSVTRPAVLARLAAALLEQPTCFASPQLLAECRSFVRLPNGSAGARPGTHDDRVIAMAIALAVRAELLVTRF